jgi:hypothetical protein
VDLRKKERKRKRWGGNEVKSNHEKKEYMFGGTPQQKWKQRDEQRTCFF